MVGLRMIPLLPQKGGSGTSQQRTLGCLLYSSLRGGSARCELDDLLPTSPVTTYLALQIKKKDRRRHVDRGWRGMRSQRSRTLLKRARRAEFPLPILAVNLRH